MKKDIELGGEEVEATILFSDIRSFTSISESMSPKQVILMLNHYLTEMNQIIEDNNGVVDKYIGDAVMAIYGAPLAHADSPGNAVRSAQAMQAAMAAINTHFCDWDIPPISIGIGINSGTVVAGNMGSMSRLNYTVLGDAVNLASRVEGLCKLYGSSIIITESTRRQCPDLMCLELDRVTVKGKSKPVTLYEPLSADTGMLSLRDQYEVALMAYREQNWQRAQGLFAGLQESQPGLLFQIYLGRIEHFIDNPPGPNWDGVFELTTK
jgi:adenylate cyclase